jgi:hypothetical protein
MDQDRMAIDLIRRILESFGWQIVAVSTEGPDIRLTIVKSKAQPSPTK